MKRKRQIIVGDIHGELEGFREILCNAGLIDGKDNWSGGNSILIQTGDVIDRGLCSREAVGLLRKLQQEAEAFGGEVVRLCGNHELMIIQGYYCFTNFNNPELLAGELIEEIKNGDIKASYTDGERLYTHAGLRSAIKQALTDEMKTLMPGLSGDNIDLHKLSSYINEVFCDCVIKDDLESHPIFHVARDRGGFDPVGGIFWCDFHSINQSEEAWRIPQIFGHTPTGKSDVKTAHGLKLIDVDAGMCEVYGGKRVYLEITPQGKLIQHSKSGLEWISSSLEENSKKIYGNLY